MDRKFAFSILSNINVSDFDTDDAFFEQLDYALDYIRDNVKSITDEEAWIFLNLTNRIAEEYLDGYMGFFDWLIEETAPSWPFGDDFLLWDTDNPSMTYFKIVCIEVGGKITRSKALPKNSSKHIDKYWDDINWSELSREELRFICLTLDLWINQPLSNYRFSLDENTYFAVSKIMLEEFDFPSEEAEGWELVSSKPSTIGTTD